MSKTNNESPFGPILPKKYTFTNQVKVVEGTILRRIVAATDFNIINPDAVGHDGAPQLLSVKKGTLGGWLESEANLDQQGPCWVADEACVYRGAEVCGAALVYGSACVSNGAKVANAARIYDQAHVQGAGTLVYNAAAVHGDSYVAIGTIGGNVEISGRVFLNGDKPIRVYGNVKISGNVNLFSDTGRILVTDDARISDYVWIMGGSRILDFAQISGQATIYGAEICDHAVVKGYTRVHTGAHIGGNAYLDILHDGDVIEAHSYIADDAVIAGSFGHLVVHVSEGIAFNFFATHALEIEMCVCKDNCEWPLLLAKHVFASDAIESLESLLEDDCDNVNNHASLPEYVELALDAARTARTYFEQRFAQMIFSPKHRKADA